MGVEMLAPHAHSLAVRSGRHGCCALQPGITASTDRGVAPAGTLLVARGTCQPGEDIEIADSEAPPRRVRVLSVVERSSAFAQVVFATLPVRAKLSGTSLANVWLDQAEEFVVDLRRAADHVACR